MGSSMAVGRVMEARERGEGRAAGSGGSHRRALLEAILSSAEGLRRALAAAVAPSDPPQSGKKHRAQSPAVRQALELNPNACPRSLDAFLECELPLLVRGTDATATCTFFCASTWYEHVLWSEHCTPDKRTEAMFFLLCRSTSSSKNESKSAGDDAVLVVGRSGEGCCASQGQGARFLCWALQREY